MTLKIEFILAGIIALVMAVGGSYIYGHHAGEKNVQAKWDAAKKAQEAAVVSIEAKQDVVTTQVVTKYVDRVQTVQGATKTIIKKVPTYVTVKDDAACTIPNGFVSLHNAAAEDSMQLPASSGTVNGQASAVKLSDVETTVAGNYGICHATAEQLIALQDWVKSQSDASKNSK